MVGSGVRWRSHQVEAPDALAAAIDRRLDATASNDDSAARRTTRKRLAPASPGGEHLRVETTTLLPEVVAAPGLEIRAWRAADVDALAEAVTRNLEHLRPWMAWIAHEPLSRAARLELIEGWAREREAGGDVVLGVLRDGEVLGGTGLHRRPGPNGLEIGYWIDREHTGRGIATAVARAMTTAAFAVDGIHLVEIHHDRANAASGRIPRRLGFTFVGDAPSEVTAPGQEGVDCTWRVLADEWRGGPLRTG